MDSEKITTRMEIAKLTRMNDSPRHSALQAVELEIRSSPLGVLGWAMFLGCSWTWCIGMWLPALLVRDMGPAGWLVFALPNVIGAAAMGWVLKNAAASQALVAKHRLACIIFSLVTLAFHVFWIGWILVPAGGTTVWAGIFGLIIVMLILGRTPGTRLDRLIAALIWLTSIGTVIWQIVGTDPSAIALSSPLTNDWESAMMLLPVCLLGFLCCPYLDLTFHRARQKTSVTGGRVAFGLGFGLFFFAMIIYSLSYALFLNGPEFGGTSGVMVRKMIFALPIALLIHMILQASFTMTVHLRSLRQVADLQPQHDSAPATNHHHSRVGAGIVGAIILGGLLTIPILIGHHWETGDGAGISAAGSYLSESGGPFSLNYGEMVYRSFLGFYGLIGPAYVWLVMLPRGTRQTPTRRDWMIVGLTILAAIVPFSLGFLTRDYPMLLAGVGIVLVMRGLIRKSAQPPAIVGESAS